MEEVVRTAITDALNELGLPLVSFTISHPENLSFGDYACNVAMVLAKEVGKSPKEIAQLLQEKLADQIEYVEKIEVAGPGFLNFYLVRDFFVSETERILKAENHWGSNDSLVGKKYIVEYTDPNPFKEFHVGHLFTNTVGESIARLCMMQGADTKRVNYQGDIGLHVAHALYGMQKLGLTSEGDFSAGDLGKAYVVGATAYKIDEEAQKEIREINKKVYDKSDKIINELYEKGRFISLAYFEGIYAVIGTQFDAYFFESEGATKGKELVLAHPEVFIESEGARVFEGEQYGLHTRVFLNKEGLPTYEAKELALAKMKENSLGVYDHSIISTANEIVEYFKVLKKAMSFVYPDLAEKTEHIGHGMVRLTSGKMSSRTGDVIPALSFIEEVTERAQEKIMQAGVTVANKSLATDIAIGAIKYATLRGNISQDTVFDTEKSLSFEGDSGPYLQYTHARICSVIEKAKEVGIMASIEKVREVPYEVEKVLYQFEEVIKIAFEERAPHKVVTYLTHLAGMFNTFYAHEKIADASDEYAPYKVAVAKAVGQTLKNGLWVLGIKAPEKM